MGKYIALILVYFVISGASSSSAQSSAKADDYDIFEVCSQIIFIFILKYINLAPFWMAIF